ncbi:hypothetical protein GWI33_012783, partial [Rhynchophorus ferrugineus]
MKDLTEQVRLAIRRYCLKYRTYWFISTDRTRVANTLIKIDIVAEETLKAKCAVVMTNTTKVESITNAEAMVPKSTKPNLEWQPPKQIHNRYEIKNRKEEANGAETLAAIRGKLTHKELAGDGLKH